MVWIKEACVGKAVEERQPMQVLSPVEDKGNGRPNPTVGILQKQHSLSLFVATWGAICGGLYHWVEMRTKDEWEAAYVPGTLFFFF